MKNRRRFNLILIVFAILLILGLGYAYLTTTLSINGITNVDANTWNVYWDNVQVTTGSVTGAQVTQAPTIDTNKTTVTFQVNLKKPGDFYEFTVDAKNDGTIDAMIDIITKTSNIPSFLNYNVSYRDDTEIESDQLLKANKKETYKIRVEYSKDIDPDDLPSTSESISLSFGTTYVQSDSNAKVVREYCYELWVSEEDDGGEFALGETLPEDAIYFDYYQDIFDAYNRPVFYRHKIVNNIITESYISFIMNDNIYNLRGGVDEENLTDKPVYEANKNILLAAFGSSNCSENDYLTCQTTNFFINVNNNGSISVNHSFNSFTGETYIFADGDQYFE